MFVLPGLVAAVTDGVVASVVIVVKAAGAVGACVGGKTTVKNKTLISMSMLAMIYN